MSKHTPGPWKLRRFPTARGGLDCWWVLDSIPDCDGQVLANAICTLTMSNDDAEANANLIAAAPDLLEEAKKSAKALRALADFLRVAGEQSLADLANEAASSAEAAIAKAEGGEK